MLIGVMKAGKNMAVEKLLRLILKLVEIFYFCLKQYFFKNTGLFLIYEFQSSHSQRREIF